MGDDASRLYEHIFDTMQEGACLYDESGRFEIVNEFLAEFYGTTRDELEGRPSQLVATIRESTDGDPYQELLDGERELLEGETEAEIPGEGRKVIEYTLSPLRIAGQSRGVVGVARDVTEQKERERQLRQAREEYQELINGMNDTAWVISPDAEFLAVNDAAVEKLGYSREELLSKKPHDIDAGLADEEITGLIDDMPEDEVQVFETVHLTKTGEEIPVEISSSLITYHDELAILSVARDITERKRYEAELEERNRLLERQRDELDVLNEVLRHDIRNDLQLVSGYAEMLDGHVDDEGEGYRETIRESASHAVELTKTARDTAEMMLRRGDENEPVALRLMVEGEVKRLRELHPSAEVVVETEIPAVSVQANRLLASVFRNLFTNAIQHNDEETPEVTISAKADNDIVTVQVADNGPGIPDTRKSDIFAEGEKGLDSQGTGLGLYLVRSLVDEYGGEVWVEDNEPEGAVFVVELPIAE